jgi:hypothetical protein
VICMPHQAFVMMMRSMLLIKKVECCFSSDYVMHVKRHAYMIVILQMETSARKIVEHRITCDRLQKERD